MAFDLYINDTRRSGIEAKRFHDKKAKWAYGGRPTRLSATKRIPGRVDRRPALPGSHYMRYV